MAAEITTAYADGELDEGLFGVELVGNNDESQRTVLDGYALEHGREHEQEHENENYYNNQENDDTTHEQLGQTLTTTTTAEEFDPEPVMSSMASSSACSSGTVINGSGSVCDQDTNSRTTTESETPIMKKPLRLLDLPLDVLRDIVKEVPNSYDLTSLALTCSALHALAIPHMYSRFDIVWPDPVSSSDDSSAVDALSYGLATLVMGADLFEGLPPRDSRLSSTTSTTVPCEHCGCNCGNRHNTLGSERNSGGVLRKVRRGNYYAQYTRKFSVGNGPLTWVQEYSIMKETGKMLGTLVALAVARMINLESFIWDMPTGVVRDVWIALSSLADRPGGHECRLERVWVRWHDNSGNPLRPVATAYSSSQQDGLSASSSLSQLFQMRRHVEYPTLSILPPLKSLSVLDIDEPSYLEEMGVLIERSRDRLKELRIGIALKAFHAQWLKPAGDLASQDTTTPNRASGWPRVGGVLGILLSRSDGPLYSQSRATCQEMRNGSTVPGGQTLEQVHEPTTSAHDSTDTEIQQVSLSSTQSEDVLSVDKDPYADSPLDVASEQTVEQQPQNEAKVKTQSKNASPSATDSSTSPNHQRLKLETLELERISLSISVMLHVLDWSQLTTLTILRCENHEKLWEALYSQYAPCPNALRSASRRKPRSANDDVPKEGNEHANSYPLRLKNIHTDAVSPGLILFIKEAIAPNSLESVFLQESPYYYSEVGVDVICRDVLRRHRMSLRKVLIDSSERSFNGSEMGTVGWRKWMFSREILSFVISRRMPRLRELGMSIHWKDWHFFLQQLPNIPHLRALYIQHIARRTHHDAKELALQILDIIAIRPEINLGYIGMQLKCYEVLESKHHSNKHDHFDADDDSHNINNNNSNNNSNNNNNPPPHVSNSFQMNDDELDPDEDDEEEEDDSDDGAASAWVSGNSSENQVSSGEDEPEVSGCDSRITVPFRLREILFYDDKISVFKARHGALRSGL